MIRPGVYPASVTPFTEKGRIDPNGVARLLSFFDASGCQGAVLAGTNGEGPSLSAVEKRDLLQLAVPLKGKLDLILGVATPSLDEAQWLCKRAAEFGATAVLLMPPFYFKSASDQAIVDWFLEILDKSPAPILAYNFPKATGITISAKMMEDLASHSNLAGCKDSSGDRQNLVEYRQAIQRPDQVLFVGDETLLLDALESGWTGTISGASNILCRFLSAVVGDWVDGNRESAGVKFELALPVISRLRASVQPSMNKACLATLGVIERSDVRLPLTSSQPEEAQRLLAEVTAALGSPM
jgi:4-hydroxy-tetrahydrodipicolinate synthase